MDKRFLAAFTDPARIKILGRFVSPFSLLRRVQLQAIESPFVCPDKNIRPSDLLVAVKICAGETIEKPTLKDSWYLGRMRNEAYFVKQLSLFTEYVLLDAWPKFWEKESKVAVNTGIPWVLNVVASLMKNGVTEERAWTMPESQAIWLHSAIAISKGADMKVLTFEEEELIKSLDKKA